MCAHAHVHTHKWVKKRRPSTNDQATCYQLKLAALVPALLCYIGLQAPPQFLLCSRFAATGDLLPEAPPPQSQLGLKHRLAYATSVP